MVYPTYEFSGQGMEGLFVYAKQIVPFFDGMLFGVILLVLTFSMYFIQEQKKGRGDFPVAFSVGCLATTILGIIISMLSGFMSGTTLGILVSLTIVSFIWLFYSTP